jgi:UDP-GlcNAc:undecaprenyl-phosphate/decaprenyl-phosphate GlcNAc-1-phosphate transferase
MSYINLFSSFIITVISLFALKPIADRLGLIDVPGGRKAHIAPTPLIGGLGIYLGTFSMCLLTPGLFAEYSALLALSALVLFVGILDDAKELRVPVRMGFHTLAALLMAGVAGVKLDSLGDIVGLGAVDLGILSIPVTVFATVGVINAINMADGLDGLSGGLVLIALGFISITAFTAGNLDLVSFVALLACAVAAFLMMNFRVLWKKRALVYLGDAGSTMLGFMLAWLLISNSQGIDAVFSPVFALWFLALPLIDTVYLFIARPLRNKSPFAPGVDHIHHNLLRRGLDVRNTVLLLYTAALMFGTIGLIGYLLQVQENFMFLAFLVLFLFYVHISQVLSRPSDQK